MFFAHEAFGGSVVFVSLYVRPNANKLVGMYGKMGYLFPFPVDIKGMKMHM